MKFIPILAFYLNLDICNFTINNLLQQPRAQEENTMYKYTRSILGNPSQQGKKSQPILFYILQEKYLPHHKPSTQKGAHKILED